MKDNMKLRENLSSLKHKMFEFFSFILAIYRVL